jgi:hypothetical protein
MVWIIGWFLGTMIVPLIIPIDKLFGFSTGSFMVISWIAAGLRQVASESFNSKRLLLGMNPVQSNSNLKALGEILLFTFGLALVIAAVKALF